MLCTFGRNKRWCSHPSIASSHLCQSPRGVEAATLEPFPRGKPLQCSPGALPRYNRAKRERILQAELTQRACRRFLPTPLQVLHAAKDVFLGRHMTADERVFANEILVERYHLAGTVFRIFGGNDVDSPQPPSMPDGRWLCVPLRGAYIA